MISYIAPNFSFCSYIKQFYFLKKRVKAVLDFFKSHGRVIIRNKQRECLLQFLETINWKNKNILIPAYTCVSIRETVQQSGNNIFLFDFEEDHFEEIKLNSIPKGIHFDAILLSDVYGLKQKIDKFLNSLTYKPLVIADFAHHDSFDSLQNDEREYIDVVMYSSAYYKPIPSSGIGVLIDASSTYIKEDDILLNKIKLQNFLKLINLILIDFALKLKISGYYSLWIKRPLTIKKSKKSPSYLISLSQLYDFIGNSKCKSIYNDYCSLIPKHYLFNGNSKHATYFSIRVPANQKEQIMRIALKEGLLLGQCFGDIAGEDCKLLANAQRLSKEVINLPFLRLSKKNTIIKNKIIKIIKDIDEYHGIINKNV